MSCHATLVVDGSYYSIALAGNTLLRPLQGGSTVGEVHVVSYLDIPHGKRNLEIRLTLHGEKGDICEKRELTVARDGFVQFSIGNYTCSLRVPTGRSAPGFGRKKNIPPKGLVRTGSFMPSGF